VFVAIDLVFLLIVAMHIVGTLSHAHLAGNAAIRISIEMKLRRKQGQCHGTSDQIQLGDLEECEGQDKSTTAAEGGQGDSA
jgi:hypothetical protein